MTIMFVDLQFQIFIVRFALHEHFQQTGIKKKISIRTGELLLLCDGVLVAYA